MTREELESKMREFEDAMAKDPGLKRAMDGAAQAFADKIDAEMLFQMRSEIRRKAAPSIALDAERLGKASFSEG